MHKYTNTQTHTYPYIHPCIYTYIRSREHLKSAGVDEAGTSNNNREQRNEDGCIAAIGDKRNGESKIEDS